MVSRVTLNCDPPEPRDNREAVSALSAVYGLLRRVAQRPFRQGPRDAKTAVGRTAAVAGDGGRRDGVDDS
jgi:hypothetical protein